MNPDQLGATGPDPSASATAAYRDLPYAYGAPPHTGTLKATPEDFRVDEDLGFAPNGDGEHVFLRIEKTGENTEYVARRLARFAAVPASAVGYAGLKDRHGCTSQWFSVSLPGRAEPDWPAFETATLRLLEVTRNQRKLRRGALAGNRFRIRLRSVTGDDAALDERLARVAAGGVPNYFGPQRFGRDGANIDAAARLLAGTGPGRVPRHLRSLYLSAARAYLFNRILAERVSTHTWNRAIRGDVFMFSNGHSHFRGDATSLEIIERIERGEIHPAGTLWGLGERPLGEAARAVEERALSREADWCRGLEQAELQTALRPLRIRPVDFDWQRETPGSLALRFTLPAGAYATSVLRELVDTGAALLPPEPDPG